MMWGTSPSTTTFSSRAVVVDDIALEEPADGGTLDEECVVLDEDGRFDAYKEVWQPFDEEKRLDLRRHARIAGAETARDALQGLEDLTGLFDESDGYDDASLDLGDNELGTRGVDDQPRMKGVGHFVPPPPLTVFVAENIITNCDWGFAGLGLSDNDLGARSQLGLQKLAEGVGARLGAAAREGHLPGFTHLRWLDLSGNLLLGADGMRNTGLAALTQALEGAPAHTAHLEKLCLGRNALHEAACAFVAQMLDAPGLAALRALDLSDNYLGQDAAGRAAPSGLVALAAACGRHYSLTGLDLSRNGGFDDAAAVAIVDRCTEKPIGGGGIQRIRLGGNPLCGARTARRLAWACELSRTLLDADLCDLDLPRPALYDLCDALPRCLSLRGLDLSGNWRCFAGDEPLLQDPRYRRSPSEALLDALRRNCALMQVRLSRCDVDPDAMRAIGRCLRANRCLPDLIKRPVRWQLESSGDAKSELLRKVCFLDSDIQQLLRSNLSFLRDTAASDVVDAVAPPSHKCLMTNDPASFLKLNDRNWMRKFAARRIQATWLAKHAPPAPTGDGPTEAELAYEASLAEHQRLTGHSGGAFLPPTGQRKSSSRRRGRRR